MEAPEKIYIDVSLDSAWGMSERSYDNEVEYTRTDAFIEKACEFLKSYRQDTCDGTGYIASIVNDKTIEDFRKYMTGDKA